MGESRRGNAGKGRKPGVPNKVTGDIKALITDLLNEPASQQSVRAILADPDHQHFAAMYKTLLGKVVSDAPTQVADVTKLPAEERVRRAKAIAEGAIKRGDLKLA